MMGAKRAAVLVCACASLAACSTKSSTVLPEQDGGAGAGVGGAGAEGGGGAAAGASGAAAGAGGVGGTKASGGNGGGSALGRWPDSASVYCIDGESEVEPCPEPGNPGYGQDGNYLISVPSYELSQDIVTDSVTGLEWQQYSSDDNIDWETAKQRCESLQQGGRQWRLPSREEAVTLLDFGGWTLPNIRRSLHWSSSLSTDESSAWVVDFQNSDVSRWSVDDTLAVLCVAGEPLRGEFTVEEDTLRHSLTGLQWQRERQGEMQWLQALDYCEGLELAGEGDWRLPNAKELLTLIVDGDQQVPGFAELPGSSHWSSSPSFNGSKATTVDVGQAETSADDTSVVNHVRCVRGPDA